MWSKIKPIAIFCTPVFFIILCYAPWAEDADGFILYGIGKTTAVYGSLGLLSACLSGVICLLLFFRTPWIRIVNVLLSTLSMAWMARNFFALHVCPMGNCFRVYAAFYAATVLSVLLFIICLNGGLSGQLVNKGPANAQPKNP